MERPTKRPEKRHSAMDILQMAEQHFMLTADFAAEACRQLQVRNQAKTLERQAEVIEDGSRSRTAASGTWAIGAEPV